MSLKSLLQAMAGMRGRNPHLKENYVMNIHQWLVLGLALVLASTLTVSVPGSAQAQANDAAGAYDTAKQDSSNSYYGYNSSGYTGPYCPMGTGYGYSAPAKRAYRNPGTPSWGRGYRGAWGPRNSGYASGSRGGWGYCR